MADRAWLSNLKHGDPVVVWRYLQPTRAATVARRTKRYIVVDGVKYSISTGRQQRTELVSAFLPLDRIERPS